MLITILGKACPLADVGQDARDQGGPAGLMAGADSPAVVPVEVFVEQHQVAPVGILEACIGAIAGSLAVGPCKEQRRQPLLEVYETWARVIICPEPVGCSTFRSSP